MPHSTTISEVTTTKEDDADAVIAAAKATGKGGVLNFVSKQYGPVTIHVDSDDDVTIKLMVHRFLNYAKRVGNGGGVGGADETRMEMRICDDEEGEYIPPDRKREDYAKLGMLKRRLSIRS